MIFAVVVVVLLVVADRLGAVVAERKVASKVQSSQHLTSKPSVTIEGFPFITQVISNRYQAIRLTAKDLSVGAGDSRIQISSLAARLTGVRATDNYSGVTARSVHGTATVGYAALSQVIGVQIGYAGPSSDGTGRVQASQTVSALGRSISGTVSAVVGVSDGQLLTFSAVKVSAAAAGVTLPQAVIDQFSSIFAKKLSLAGLPFGLRIQQLTATAAGVTVTAEASNVTLG
ncbi:MAG: DUF2993 domain-containing protein [Jatrophihabitantaceae bacterium]